MIASQRCERELIWRAILKSYEHRWVAPMPSRDAAEQLNLELLKGGTPGITPAYGACFCDAACVCLEDQEHINGAKLHLDGDFQGAFSLNWNPTTPQIRRCWANEGFTTEHGAYGIAVLLILKLTDFTVLEAAKTWTGFDFWLGSETRQAELLQNKARLEVSGIRNGSEGAIRSRITQKVSQVKPSDSSMLPAFIIVVEFGTPRSRVIKK